MDRVVRGGRQWGLWSIAIVADKKFEPEVGTFKRADAGQGLAKHRWTIVGRHNDRNLTLPLHDLTCLLRQGHTPPPGPAH